MVGLIKVSTKDLIKDGIMEEEDSDHRIADCVMEVENILQIIVQGVQVQGQWWCLVHPKTAIDVTGVANNSLTYAMFVGAAGTYLGNNPTYIRLVLANNDVDNAVEVVVDLLMIALAAVEEALCLWLVLLSSVLGAMGMAESLPTTAQCVEDADGQTEWDDMIVIFDDLLSKIKISDKIINNNTMDR